MEFTLRGYQQEALDRVERAVGRGVRRQLGVAACGLGKTVIFVSLARRLGCRTLIIAHRDELIEQAAAQVRQWWPEVDVGIVKGDRNEVAATVVVASVQTLSRPKRLAQMLAPTVLADAPNFGLVIVDECFPAGTMVGDQLIEMIRVGDIVPSWDEATDRLVYRAVRTVMSRPASALCTVVMTDGERITCTLEHPFLTASGWQPAKDLTGQPVRVSMVRHEPMCDLRRSGVSESDDVLEGLPVQARCSETDWAETAEPTSTIGSHLHWLRHRRVDTRGRTASPSVVAQGGSGVLLGPVSRGSDVGSVLYGHGGHKPSTRLREDDEPQPDGSSRGRRQDEGDAESDRSQADRAGRQRIGANDAAGFARWITRLARRGNRSDRTTMQGRPALALQDRHRRRDHKGGNRGRRPVSLDVGTTRGRSTERRMAGWRGVARVEIHEQGGPGGRGADRIVYNLEVEGTHTYLVGSGVIVHNCHHSQASSYRSVMHGLRCDEPDGPLLLGVTATPDRGDGKGLDDLFDEVTFAYDIRWGITHGYLSDLRGIRVKLAADFGGLKVQRGDYDVGHAGAMLDEADAPNLIAKAWLEHAAGRRTIVFTPTVATAESVAEAFRAVGVKAASVDGAMSIDERRSVLAAYSRGDVDVLTNCQIALEGYDEPRTDCVIWARPTKSRALYTQGLGRGCRIHPEKLNGCLVIDVVGASDVHDLVTVPSLFGIERPEKVWADGAEQTVTEVLREQVETHEREGRLLATEARLFDKVREQGKMAWVSVHTPGGQRRYELSMGRDKGELVLLEVDPDRWRAGWRDPAGAKRVLMDDVPLELAQGVAEDLCRKLGAANIAATDARWRQARPSRKQRDAAKKFGIVLPVGCTKGDASDLLGAHLAKLRARKRTPTT